MRYPRFITGCMSVQDFCTCTKLHNGNLATGSFPFLDLPRELRDAIYEDYISSDRTCDECGLTDLNILTSSSLGLVNPQVISEFRQALSRHEWLVESSKAFSDLERDTLNPFNVSMTRIALADTLIPFAVVLDRLANRLAGKLNRNPDIAHIVLEIEDCNWSAKLFEPQLLKLFELTFKKARTFSIRRVCTCATHSEPCICEPGNVAYNHCRARLNRCDACFSLGVGAMCELHRAERDALHADRHAADHAVEETVRKRMRGLRKAREREPEKELGLLEGLFDEE